MNREKIVQILKYIVLLLVNTDFKELEALDSGTITESEIAASIQDYPGNLTMPPDDDFNLSDPDRLIEISEDEWFVDYDLWVDNKESDLTLSIRFLYNAGQYQFMIEGIHVL